MTELDNIRDRYQRRNADVDTARPSVVYYERKIRAEREEIISKLIRKRFKDVNAIKILEVGAGTGGNVPLFISIGVQNNNIVLNELLEERLKILREIFPAVRIISGDALQIDESENFDIVFQFTVFTSILDSTFRKQLATKMIHLLKKNGSIFWYDFIYNNPKNKDVRGISIKELRQLFPECSLTIYPVTLAPPIGRRVGRLYTMLYHCFPFLRTHVIAEIRKL